MEDGDQGEIPSGNASQVDEKQQVFVWCRMDGRILSGQKQIFFYSLIFHLLTASVG